MGQLVSCKCDSYKINFPFTVFSIWGSPLGSGFYYSSVSYLKKIKSGENDIEAAVDGTLMAESNVKSIDFGECRKGTGCFLKLT